MKMTDNDEEVSHKGLSAVKRNCKGMSKKLGCWRSSTKTSCTYMPLSSFFWVFHGMLNPTSSVATMKLFCTHYYHKEGEQDRNMGSWQQGKKEKPAKDGIYHYGSWSTIHVQRLHNSFLVPDPQVGFGDGREFHEVHLPWSPSSKLAIFSKQIDPCCLDISCKL